MTSLADQLIDAQVTYVLEQLGGTELERTLAEAVDDLLAIGGSLQLEEVLDPEHVKAVVRRLLASVPASTGASEIVDIATEVVYAGPATPFALGELVVREQVEALLDEILGLAPLVERALEQLTDSPLVGMVASRFMGRIVGEVLAANKAVADKVPGLGSLVSFGTSAASRVKGVADKQFEALLGDTAGKGAAFAVRRLNKIIIDTIQDPATREAVLQVWDLAAEEPVGGLGHHVERDALSRIVYAAQSVVATAAGTEQAAALVDAYVDGFFARYGALPVTTLLDELEVDRDALVADLRAAAPRAVEAARASGALERIIRARVEPFYRSPAVVALLG
jgi:hypothetical protein